MKTCSSCRETKPEEAFSPDNRYCKACRNAYARGRASLNEGRIYRSESYAPHAPEIETLKKILGVQKDVEFLKLIGANKALLSNWKKRIPPLSLKFLRIIQIQDGLLSGCKREQARASILAMLAE